MNRVAIRHDHGYFRRDFTNLPFGRRFAHG